MNNLILIGNGFDLAHGLKTSYGDFVLWYLNKIRCDIEPYKNYDDNLISIDPSQYVNKKDPFASIIEALKYFDELGYKIHYKYDLIKRLIKDMATSNWVDIEYFYYSLLVSIYRDYERNFSKYEINAKASAESLNRCFSAIISLLEQYLSTIAIDENTRNPFISSVLTDIVEPERYKSKQVNPPYTLLLNFNYTNTLGLYALDLDMDNSQTNVVSIHGLINSQINPIVFGYGDEMDPYYPKLENLNINGFLDYIKSFHYFKTGNYRELVRFLNDKFFNVYIMGHSCGISDRILLNSIFEHPKCQNIKIYYHKRDDGTSDYFEKTQEISRHFKPEYKSVMRKRIVPFDECKPLS